MKKLIIFDLDGVLIDTKDTHYIALNMALEEAGQSYVITESEHISTYDGLSTKEKLKMLSEGKNLPASEHKRIWTRKQQITNNELDKIVEDEKLIQIFNT